MDYVLFFPPQNILLRYGKAHNLTFVLPPQKTHIFPILEPFQAKFAKGAPYQGDKSNIFTVHAKWNKREVT